MCMLWHPHTYSHSAVPEGTSSDLETWYCVKLLFSIWHKQQVRVSLCVFQFILEAQAKTLQSKLYLRFTLCGLVPSTAAFQQILNKEYKTTFISTELFSFEAEES